LLRWVTICSIMFYSPSNVLRLFLCGCNAQAVINEELLWSVGVVEYWSIGKTFKTQKNSTSDLP
jgi:hypothetical protein